MESMGFPSVLFFLSNAKLSILNIDNSIWHSMLQIITINTST